MEPTLAIAASHLEPIARARIRLQHLAARCERIGLRDGHRACLKAVEAIDDGGQPADDETNGAE